MAAASGRDARLLPPLPFGERYAGGARHLIGADQALRIAGVETRGALGIELGQRGAECSPPSRA